MQTALAALRNAFVSNGMLRPIWRACLFFAIGVWIVSPITDRIWTAMAAALHVGTDLSAGTIAFYELETLVVAAVTTGLFAFSPGLRCKGPHC